MFKKSSLACGFMSAIVVTGLSCGSANAFEHVGPYGFFKGGLNYTSDQSFNTGTAQATPRSARGLGVIETELDPGLVVMGGGGYDFGHTRLEGELSYRYNGVDMHTAGSNSQAGSDGEMSSVAMMANAYYDFSNESPYTPYVGAGIGMAVIGADEYRNTGNVLLGDSDVVFAYQVMAGMDYDMSDYFSLGAEYRYFATADADVHTTLGGNDTSLDYANHSVLLGMKYKISPRKAYSRRRY